jgi:hypothetical protein
MLARSFRRFRRPSSSYDPHLLLPYHRRVSPFVVVCARHDASSCSWRGPSAWRGPGAWCVPQRTERPLVRGPGARRGPGATQLAPGARPRQLAWLVALGWRGPQSGARSACLWHAAGARPACLWREAGARPVTRGHGARGALPCARVVPRRACDEPVYP